jgi:hypothetical protein
MWVFLAGVLVGLVSGVVAGMVWFVRQVFEGWE